VESTITRGPWFLVVISDPGDVCLAQEGLTVHSKGKQEVAAAGPKIYLSACSVVQREFAAIIGHARVTLFWARQERGWFDERELGLPNG